MGELIEIAELLHVFGGMILVGGGIFAVAGLLAADKQSDPAVAAAPILIALRWVWLPALIAQPALGVFVAWAEGINLMEFWLLAASVLYAAGIIAWIIGTGLAVRAARVGAGEPGLRRRRNIWLAAGLATFIAITPLMLFKPYFGGEPSHSESDERL